MVLSLAVAWVSVSVLSSALVTRSADLDNSL